MIMRHDPPEEAVTAVDREDIRHLRRSLRALERELGWQWKNDASCCGITVAQCHALLELDATEGMSLVELAAALGLDTSTLSRTVDGMVQAALVRRSADPGDRRYVRIELAPHGRAVRDDIEQTFNAHFAAVLGAIPAEKRRQVVESLAVLVEAVRQSRQGSGEAPHR